VSNFLSPLAVPMSVFYGTHKFGFPYLSGNMRRGLLSHTSEHVLARAHTHTHTHTNTLTHTLINEWRNEDAGKIIETIFYEITMILLTIYLHINK